MTQQNLKGIIDQLCPSSLYIGNMLACDLSKASMPKGNNKCKYISSTKEIIDYDGIKPKRYFACYNTYFMR